MFNTRKIDYLFSFLCPVIIPDKLLKITRIKNINLHPAPPEYPGIGSVSRALYDERSEFGVTAHLMEKKVDKGKILKVKRFPILNDDTCEKLDFRAKQSSIDLMKDILKIFSKEDSDFTCNDKWSGFVMNRKKFKEWMQIPLNASKDETDRKIKALSHSKFPGPFLQIHGHKFAYNK